jgi:hypothetical protein
MMDATELAEELNQPGAQELLCTGALARLGYAGRDGLPRVIPVGFLWDRQRLLVCTASIAPKVKALAERPDVALSIDTGEGTARALLIRGAAAIEIVDGVPAEFLAAAAKTMAPDELPAFEAQSRAMYRQMARISITPGWARYYDFGTGRMPGFLHKLAAGG